MGEGVEAAVVDAEAESAIMLFREKYAGSKRGVGWLDPAVARVLVQLGLEGAVLLGVHPVDPVTRRNSVGDQVDAVVRCAGGWEALWKVFGEDARKKLLEGRRDWSLGDGA